MMPAWLDTLLYEWVLPYIIYIIVAVATAVWMVQYWRTGISVWDSSSWRRRRP